uniref:Uncharacterized protein n=1 Tax=Arion vulgaris TaxID=1028688 RepID=A0A0B6XY29_9EUPU
MSAKAMVFLAVYMMLNTTSVNSQDSLSQKMAKCIENHLGSECPSQKAHILDCANKNGGRSLGRDGIRSALAQVENDGYNICPKLTPHVFLDILNSADCNKAGVMCFVILLQWFSARILFYHLNF